MDICAGGAATGLNCPTALALSGWGVNEVQLHGALQTAKLCGPSLVPQGQCVVVYQGAPVGYVE